MTFFSFAFSFSRGEGCGDDVVAGVVVGAGLKKGGGVPILRFMENNAIMAGDA